MPPLPLPQQDAVATLRGLLRRVAAVTSYLSKRTASPHLRVSPNSNVIQDGSAIVERQVVGIIPTGYQTGGMNPSSVAGIVLGSVAGFLLIVILIWSLFNGRRSSRNSITGEEEIVVRRRDRSPHRSHRSRRSRSDREIVREVRELSRSPRRASRTIVEERVERMRERTPPPRGGFIVEDRIETSRPPPPRRVAGDDIVEVIEEQSVSTHSPPRRHRSRRSSGYRQVDPNLYAGGDYPQRPVRSGSRRYS